MKPKRSAS